MHKVNITFGIIVLNGEPFIKYNLESLYTFSHQIIVVEGACPSAANVASIDGHSRDGTLETLKDFKNNNDLDDKIIIVTAETDGHNNGFWSEKDEMSQAYARRATGNYLWQIDIDEFYKADDIAKILEILSLDPDLTEISFRTLTFWGGLGYRVDGLQLRCGEQDFHRLFAWKQGYKYLTHRPPTVINEKGHSLATIKKVTASELAAIGIYLYHYEYLFPLQVRNKVEYYANAPHCRGLRPDQKWMDENYMNINHPFKVHNISGLYSWLLRFKGTHPEKIENMMNDVSNGVFPNIGIRQIGDIEIILNSIWYRFTVMILIFCSPAVYLGHFIKLKVRSLLIAIKLWPLVQLIRGK